MIFIIAFQDNLFYEMPRKMTQPRKTFDVSKFHTNTELEYYSIKDNSWVNFVVFYVTKTKMTGFIFIRYPNGSTRMGNVIHITTPSKIKSKKIGCMDLREYFKNRDNWIRNPTK